MEVGRPTFANHSVIINGKEGPFICFGLNLLGIGILCVINNFYFRVIASIVVLSATFLFKVILIRHPGKWLGHHQLGQLLRGLLHLHLCGSSQLCRLDYD